ncbi:hypothetical protein Pmani_039105 [Petrolisthes manimaculis]|uniref:L-fucose mutarotase n=1 Tax=Petrolisthes manimaculis TaxID=1843537 RepID=A0AAE1NFM7_9EUCA|nr:hypothetical protein Pmani_039105 [Petrolisthes manimaculis]
MFNYTTLQLSPIFTTALPPYLHYKPPSIFTTALPPSSLQLSPIFTTALPPSSLQLSHHIFTTALPHLHYSSPSIFTTALPPYLHYSSPTISSLQLSHHIFTTALPPSSLQLSHHIFTTALPPYLHYSSPTISSLQLSPLSFFTVLADMNFPTHSICSGGEGRPKEYRADGVGVGALLEGILKLMPLDSYTDYQIGLMDRTPIDVMQQVAVKEWKSYRKICDQAYGSEVKVEYIKRFEFYERAKKAYAIIHTGETAPYSNVIMKRGVC